MKILALSCLKTGFGYVPSNKNCCAEWSWDCLAFILDHMKILMLSYHRTGCALLNEKLLCLFVYCVSCDDDGIAICEENMWGKVATSLHDL